MAGPGKEGRPLPALVAGVFEERMKARRLAEIQERHAGPVTDRVTRLIKATVPDPHPDLDERVRAQDSDRLIVTFPFESDGDIVNVTIYNPNYPRDLDDVGQYEISVGEETRLQVDQLGLHRYENMGPSEDFDDQDLEEFNGLLQAIEDGIADGSIRPVIDSPLPYFVRSPAVVTSAS